MEGRRSVEEPTVGSFITAAHDGWVLSFPLMPNKEIEMLQFLRI